MSTLSPPVSPSWTAAPAGRAASAPRLHPAFVIGGAWLVPVPIAGYGLMRAAGVPVGVAEDLVTLLVMVPLGGPHVVATFARTLFAKSWWRRERGLAIASVAVWGIVLATVIASTVFGVRLAGAPAMTSLLTFFFFWAGLHVAQQHCWVAATLVDRTAAVQRVWLRSGQLAMLVALYPVSLFRMSMGNPADATRLTADPDALATRIVMALGASREAADDYVFRIGRMAPLLPEWLRHPACWILAGTLLVVAMGVFALATRRVLAHGGAVGAFVALVVAVTGLGALVPLVPSLDVAFQGLNAWHACQYLAVAWVLQQRAVQNGEVDRPWLRAVSGRADAVRSYLLAVGATVALVLVIFAVGAGVQAATGGAYVLFGHDTPPRDPSTGLPLYRPGALLLAYYVCGFGFLLVHYLQDTVHFLRRRC